MEELCVVVKLSTIVHSSTGENMYLRYLHKNGLGAFMESGTWE